MTIQDTIPKWNRPWTRKGNQIRAKMSFRKEGSSVIYVDQHYTFSMFGPYSTDRYYFRIKLKPKK